MNLLDMIAAFEKDFRVSPEVGYADDRLEGRADMARAPTGERYVSVTSGGLKDEGEAMPGWFATEALAIDAWLRSAWKYAEDRGGHDLYWRERPVYQEAEYIAINQAALMGDPRFRDAITLRLGCVYSRLLVSKKD